MPDNSNTAISVSYCVRPLRGLASVNSRPSVTEVVKRDAIVCIDLMILANFISNAQRGHMNTVLRTEVSIACSVVVQLVIRQSKSQ